jgi:DNA polymerase III subunit gamma/tau
MRTIGCGGARIPTYRIVEDGTMTQELYKRYRPKTLERVIGNTETVQALTTMLAKNEVPHTILFSGPSGTGKTSLSRIMRKALECHDMDLTELNCSSFRGIDTVRDIQKTMNLAPVGGKCRIWILDEFQMMTREGQNSALKMLEDTPTHVYFFICTTDPHKLIPAIQTRCTHMVLRLLEMSEIELLLSRVCKKEDISLEKSDVDRIVDACGGSPRTALVLLDKIRHLPPKERHDALQIKSDTESQAIDLCRALLKKTDWRKIAMILKTIKVEPEQIRWAVLGYAKSVLLGSDRSGAQAYTIIRAFSEPFFDSKEAGLTAACYEVIFG